MTSRRTIAAVGALLLVPWLAAAQPVKVHRIGLLGTTPPTAGSNPLSDAFFQGLRDHGYIEGQNLHVERRFSEGKADRLPGLAADLMRLGVSVIVAGGPAPSRAAKDATATIPIVFVGVADPVGLGLVDGYARPGGNVTGLASVEWETFTAKQLEIIKESLPRTARVAILMNPTNRMNVAMVPQTQAAAKSLGVTLQLIEAREPADLGRAVEAAIRERADALHVWGDPLTFSQRARIAELTLKHRLPTMHLFAEAVDAGGLFGFGPDWVAIWRNAGKFVDKILKGTRPADIPVEQPTKYALTINLKTARTLGLTIPPAVLLRADRLIE